MADQKNTGTSNRKVANGVVALSSAAVLAVYSAGYVRTKAAAERLEAAAQRRPHLPMPASGATPEIALSSQSAVADSPVAAASVETGVRPETPQTASNLTARGADPAAVPSAAAAPTTANASDAAAPATSPNLPAASSGDPAAIVAKTETAPAAPAPAPVAIPTASLPIQQGERPATPVAPPATPAPVAPVVPAAASGWKDGKYLGWGYSRHGDIQAQVVIENGRIAYAVIAKCLTRYSCSIIEHLQKQVAQRQGPEVDYVAGATESADAFYGAVVEALKQAR